MPHRSGLKRCHIIADFVRRFCWALRLCPQVKWVRAFYRDGIILRPNFDSNMVSIFCGKPKLDNMWDIMSNICERAKVICGVLYRKYLREPNNMENI